MLLAGFHPKSQLVTKTTPVEKPRFLLIDPHNHLSEPYGGGWDEKPLLELLDLLDEAGVITYVYLDGSWSEKNLNAQVAHTRLRVWMRIEFMLTDMLHDIASSVMDSPNQEETEIVEAKLTDDEKHFSLFLGGQVHAEGM
jgi:hypothetical protein